MTQPAAVVRLALVHPDALQLLRRALENSEASCRAMAVRDAYAASLDPAARAITISTAALERRVAVYTERAGVVAGLLAQLPAASPLPAHKDS